MFADPTRRRILQLLRERPMTAGQIAEHFIGRDVMEAELRPPRPGEPVVIGERLAHQAQDGHVEPVAVEVFDTASYSSAIV